MRAAKHQNKWGAWLEAGDGPAVVLLHGFGEDKSIFNRLTDGLPGFRIILPDLPGSGDTPMIEDMSMEGLAAWLEKGLRTIGIENFVLIGHSMGGYVALAFAEKFPERISGLGLFHSTAYPDTDEKKKTRRKGIEFIKNHNATAFLETAIPGLYSPDTRTLQPHLIEEQLQESKHFSSAALIQYYEAMMARPDRTRVLEEIQVPVLFIFGKHDSAVPIADGWKQASLPQTSFVYVLEYSGHMGMREEPEHALQYINEFLNSL